MPAYQSDIVAYHERSPDPLVEGCQNTGAVEDGVVFFGVEPLIGTDLFIGRTSIIEAAAVLFGTTPAAVVRALSKKPKRKEPDAE
jgi:hypothetical protein